MSNYSCHCKDGEVRAITYRKANLPYGIKKSYKGYLGDIYLCTLYSTQDGWSCMLQPSKFFNYVDLPRAYSHNGGFKSRRAAMFFVLDLLQIHISQPKERQDQLFQQALFQAALALRPIIKDKHETVS